MRSSSAIVPFVLSTVARIAVIWAAVYWLDTSGTSSRMDTASARSPAASSVRARPKAALTIAWSTRQTRA